MVFSCILCEKETCYIANLCTNCRRVKHLISVYDHKVYDVLEDVLVRANKGIINKCKKKLEEEKQNVEDKIEETSTQPA